MNPRFGLLTSIPMLHLLFKKFCAIAGSGAIPPYNSASCTLGIKSAGSTYDRLPNIASKSVGSGANTLAFCLPVRSSGRTLGAAATMSSSTDDNGCGTLAVMAADGAEVTTGTADAVDEVEANSGVTNELDGAGTEVEMAETEGVVTCTTLEGGASI